MARTRIPAYRKHSSGQARVTFPGGRTIYLGRWNSAESRSAYNRAIEEWLSHGRKLPESSPDRSINRLILAYWEHCEKHYLNPAGQPTSELHCQRIALKPLRRIYGTMPADDFGPAELRVVRDAMIRNGWHRRSINLHLSCLKHLFRWGGEHGHVKPDVYHRLLCVRGLQANRTDAKESEPVKPVPDELVSAVLPHVSRQVAAMIQLQLLTGMRPGDVTIMRACDIEMSGSVWIYRPQHHKTAWRGHQREIYLGPKAQAVVRDSLKLDTQQFLFSPADAEEERRSRMRQQRKTVVQPSQRLRNKPHPKRAPGDHYTVAGYRRAITRACDEAFPLPEHLQPRRLESGRYESKKAWKARLTADEQREIRAWRRAHRWHPHQLRHNAATRLRKQFGLELARIILGHKTAFTTEIYAETDRQQAVEVMAKIG